MSRKIPFLTVTANADSSAPAEISIRGIIGQYWDSETYSISDTETDVLNELNKIPAGKKINARINSKGGDIGITLGCYNALSSREADVTTINCGYACSAASVLMLAGAKRISPASSVWMIHRAAAETTGNAKDKLKDAEMLQKHDDMMASLYAKAAGGTPQEWLDKMDAETWMTGEEAVQMKLATHADADGEMDSDGDAAASAAEKRIVATFKHVPKNLQSRFTVTAQAVPTPTPQPTQPKNNMKKIIDALVAAGFTVSADATEDLIALLISRDIAPIRAENQRHIEARKTRVTTLLDAAITDKVIADTRKTSLLAFGCSGADGEAEVMAQISELRAMKATTVRGARPVPRGEGDTSDSIEALLEEQGDAIAANNSEALANINAKLAKARGRENLFTLPEERPAHRN